MKNFSLSPVFCAHNGVVLLEQNDKNIVIGMLKKDEALCEKIETRYLQFLHAYFDIENIENIHNFISYKIIDNDTFIRKTSKEFSYNANSQSKPSLLVENDYEENIQSLTNLIEDAPIIHLLNSLVLECIEKKGSDIHIEPFKDGARIKMRIFGDLELYSVIDSKTARALVLRILFLAGLDITEIRKSQDGAFHFEAGSVESEVRVSMIPSSFGSSCVLRILIAKDFVQNFYDLGFSPCHREFLESICSKTNSLFLVCGATGAGKSTTLAAMLHSLANHKRKIITIEDPVEYRLDGIIQIPVNLSLDMDFPSVLRSTFRHDPDVIMVGEIRDEKTAQIAVRSALTGHLVLATLHTIDAPSSIIRLLDMGIESWLLSSVFGGAICQRLVKKYSDYGVSYLPVAEILPSCNDIENLILKKASICEYRTWMQEHNIMSMIEDEAYATCI